MSDLFEAIRLIERQARTPQARCVIADEGAPDESSLLGTRDGYLNLALMLLRFVADADAGRCAAGEGYAWDDRVKSALYQLPTSGAWLVGAYLFDNHDEFITTLAKMVGPRLAHPYIMTLSSRTRLGPGDTSRRRSPEQPTLLRRAGVI